MPRTRLAITLLLLVGFTPAFSQVPVVSPNTFTLRISGNTVRIPYYRNLAIDTGSPAALRAVILLHGDDRTADDTYDTLLESADLANASAPSTLLLAPQFLLEIDITAHALGAEYAFWSDSGWKQGDRSQTTTQHPRPVRVSSFAVMDTILYRLATRNPNLQRIVVAGHSAGGQFVNRYAAGNQVEQVLRSGYGIDVQYVVANPSSYLYFDAQRIVPGTMDEFAVPSPATVQSCPGYNDYKYGLLQLNTYMAAVSVSQIRSQYESRSVTVLLGELDNDPTSPTLDQTCEAKLQGPYRLARGLIYFEYLLHYYGADILDTHEIAVIPDVGHTSNGIFTSDCGVTTLFSNATCHPVTDTETNGFERQLSMQIMPNPLRTSTTILYRAVEYQEPVTLRIHDIRGRVVRTLVGDPRSLDRGGFVWDASTAGGTPVASGIYFLRLHQGSRVLTRKVTVLR